MQSRCVWLTVLAWIGLAAVVVAADLVSERAELDRSYRQQLDELAADCERMKLADAATTLRRWLPERSDDHLTLFVLPELDSLAAANLPEWQARWSKLREAQADRLWALARQAAVTGRAALAGELAVETLRENSQHEAARKLLGYVNKNGRWATPFEHRQLQAGKVDHPDFGWLPKAHVERYEAGERFYLGRWMSAAEEAELRGDLKRGWRVETEHFIVTTNHSQQEGVRLARRLEALHAIWRQVFLGYLYSDDELRRGFEGRPLKRDARQHNVVYFRNRREYNDSLRAAQPKIDMTLGIYFDTTRTAYFFAGEDQQPGTLFHEATHQLFHESRSVAKNIGREHNFWVVEGIACYMESLTPGEGYFTLGGDNAGRMPAARHRLFEDQFYVPLAELTALSMKDLQQAKDIAKIYSQSAGLCDFFMHARQGRYRDALAHYLEAIYTGRATTATLAEACGESYEALDRQYREFMADEAAASTSAAAR